MSLSPARAPRQSLGRPDARRARRVSLSVVPTRDARAPSARPRSNVKITASSETARDDVAPSPHRPPLARRRPRATLGARLVIAPSRELSRSLARVSSARAVALGARLATARRRGVANERASRARAIEAVDAGARARMRRASRAS